MAATETTNETAKPKALKNPIRKRVKRMGKRLTRAIAHHQARVSLVPDEPFLDPGLFPFLNELRDNWETIADETRGVLQHREAIPGFQDLSPDQYRIATEKNWRTFVLYGFGQQLEKNSSQMPKTAEMLSRVPNLQIAWLSILAPGYHIPAHTGVTKGLIRTGELVVLDDTYDHEVWNDTDEERVVLLFDFDRPMKWSGRALNKFFLWLIKFSAFYRDPLRNALDYQDRFEAATRRADEVIEKMSD